LNVQLTVDGSSTPWKKGAVGLVVRDIAADRVIDTLHQDLAGRCTNNVAEYTAVIRACEYAIRHEYVRPLIVTDSQLVFRQISGEYSVKKKELRNLHRAVVKLLRQIKATLRWHKRDEGDGPLADKLASYKWKEVVNANRGNVRQSRAGEHAERPVEAPRPEVVG
jgi:ribonuclease HI